LLPWLAGVGNAILLLPKMMGKRKEIAAMRRVSESYLEEIIVKSEADLAASKQRLHAQVLKAQRAESTTASVVGGPGNQG
jgi:hypothetical protein